MINTDSRTEDIISTSARLRPHALRKRADERLPEKEGRRFFNIAQNVGFSTLSCRVLPRLVTSTQMWSEHIKGLMAPGELLAAQGWPVADYAGTLSPVMRDMVAVLRRVELPDLQRIAGNGMHMVLFGCSAIVYRTILRHSICNCIL